MLYGFDRNEKRVIFERNIPVNDQYKNQRVWVVNTNMWVVNGKWVFEGVGGKWSDKYIYENQFFDYLNTHEHSGAIIAHLPRGTHIRGWLWKIVPLHDPDSDSLTNYIWIKHSGAVIAYLSVGASQLYCNMELGLMMMRYYSIQSENLMNKLETLYGNQNIQSIHSLRSLKSSWWI